MNTLKKCVKCGKNFEKKINYSKKYWETARFCSKSCSKIGKSSWNKGIPMTEERKLYLHKILLGRTLNTGRTHIKKGQHLSPSTELKPGLIPWSKGKKNPYVTGEKNCKWKGGITSEHNKIRNSVKMKNFRNEVFKRDNYTCRHCLRFSKKGDKVILNVHHIKSFAKYPELIFYLDNAITLCLECHTKTDSYGINL